MHPQLSRGADAVLAIVLSVGGLLAHGQATSPVATSTNTTNDIASRPGRNSNEQWPYSFKLTGTTPDNSIVH